MEILAIRDVDRALLGGVGRERVPSRREGAILVHARIQSLAFVILPGVLALIEHGRRWW